MSCLLTRPGFIRSPEACFHPADFCRSIQASVFRVRGEFPACRRPHGTHSGEVSASPRGKTPHAHLHFTKTKEAETQSTSPSPPRRVKTSHCVATRLGGSSKLTTQRCKIHNHHPGDRDKTEREIEQEMTMRAESGQAATGPTFGRIQEESEASLLAVRRRTVGSALSDRRCGG